MNVKVLKQWLVEYIESGEGVVWRKGYENTFNKVHEIKKKLESGYTLTPDTDEEFLSELLKDTKNGVASKGQSNLANKVFEQMIRDEKLLESVQKLILNPNLENYNLLHEYGRQLLERLGSTNRPLLFNRACASCTLDVSTVVDDRKFNELVNYLQKQKIVEFKEDINQKNWYERNIYLVKKIREAFAEEINNKIIDIFQVNIFIWDIYAEKVATRNVNTTLNNLKLGDKKLKQPLNRILFGAAGTGKTFHSINHALSVIENQPLEVLEQEDRTALKLRFDQYKEQGQIKFVTFHQSFSYEDFVEGIRAESDKQDNLKFKVEAGVFKKLCNEGKQFADDLIVQIQDPLEFGRGYVLKKMTTEVLEIQKPNGNIIHLSRALTDFLLKNFKEEKITIRNLADKKVIEILSESEILEPYLVNGYSAIWANLIPFLNDYISDVIAGNKEHKNYVLIIDEINRGNISRIFGELITLIEDSKRKGAEEELSVTLPYSKEEFSVPNNVYIIGTMNSSDRSLTGLDIALRRRFTFIEMPPKPELLNGISIEGVNIGKLLDVMNQRIEVLLDRDHCIGHANFMSLSNDSELDDLAQIFKQKIIPQLQEYFFDDWEKINLVLFNNGMVVENNKINISSLFPNSMDQEYFEQKKIWKIDDKAFKTIDAFSSILDSKD